MNVKIINNKIEHLLFDMHANLSRFQIFNNKSSRVDCVSRRVFEKFIRKNVECFFYFIRNVEKFVKMSKKLIFIQRIINVIIETQSFNIELDYNIVDST